MNGHRRDARVPFKEGRVDIENEVIEVFVKGDSSSGLGERGVGGGLM